MNILPRHLIGRILLVLWSAACVAVLVFAFIERDVEDTGIAVMWLMIILNWPIGYLVAVIMGYAFKLLYEVLGAVVPGGFGPLAFLWFVFVAVGYFQWFVAFPWAYYKIRTSSARIRGDAT